MIEEDEPPEGWSNLTEDKRRDESSDLVGWYENQACHTIIVWRDPDPKLSEYNISEDDEYSVEIFEYGDFFDGEAFREQTEAEDEAISEMKEIGGGSQ